MCNNFNTNFHLPDQRLKSFHEYPPYQQIIYLSTNGFVYDGNNRATCHFCGVSVDIRNDQVTVHIHHQGCRYGKRDGPSSDDVTSGSCPVEIPEENQQEQTQPSVQEEEGALRNQQEVFQTRRGGTNPAEHPVVNLTDSEVHLAQETHTGSIPSDGTTEAPLAVGQSLTAVVALEEYQNIIPAGVQPQEMCATSELYPS